MTKFTDVFGITHDDCTVVKTLNDYERIFLIEDPDQIRYVAIKENAPKKSKLTIHWEPGNPKNIPDNYFGMHKRTENSANVQTKQYTK